MRPGQKTTYVGQFFEEVGHTIFGGELTRNADADICLFKSETVLEVKASGDKSSYGWRLSVNQIEHYERISSFPFSRAWYVLFAYRNRSVRNGKNGKRRTELSGHTTSVSVNRYLSTSEIWCVVVDISLISRWKEVLPRSEKSILGHLGTETVDLKCSKVHSFMNGGFVPGLVELKLDPANFVRFSGEIETCVKPDLFNQYKMRVPIAAVLPESQSLSFQRMLKRRGFSLRKDPH